MNKATTTKPIDQGRAKAEQTAVEGTAEYQAEQMSWQAVEDELFRILDAEQELELQAAFQLIEDELFALEASEQAADEVEAMRRAGLHVDEYQAAAQMRNATTMCRDGSYW